MSATTATALKQALAARHRLLVVNADYSNASLVQFLARELADVVFIDCEQGDASIQIIPDLVRAAHVEHTPVLVRLPDPRPETIERYMFRGCDGIVVPRLDLPSQAAAVVETVQYCFGEAACQKSVVIQIESVAAAKAIRGFLDMPGIDALFIGPVDLARSMGKAGRYHDPDVRSVIDELISTIVAAGRSAGMLAQADTIAALDRTGVNFLYLHANDFLLHGRAPFGARPPKGPDS